MHPLLASQGSLSSFIFKVYQYGGKASSGASTPPTPPSPPLYQTTVGKAATRMSVAPYGIRGTTFAAPLHASAGSGMRAGVLLLTLSPHGYDAGPLPSDTLTPQYGAVIKQPCTAIVCAGTSDGGENTPCPSGGARASNVRETKVKVAFARSACPHSPRPSMELFDPCGCPSGNNPSPSSYGVSWSRAATVR